MKECTILENLRMYKNGDHRQFCANDSQRNSGPPINNVDPTQTVKVSYSTVFGRNAGQQCAAMSLCALNDINIKRINRQNGLVQIIATVDNCILRCHNAQGK